MTDELICSECGSGHLHPATWEGDFRHNGAQVHVTGLECYRCEACGADPVFTDQIRRNQLRIADAKRRADGLLTGAEVCKVRGHLGLSQQQASVLFGGGANAFSKYERGDVLQSVAMDRLLKAAAYVPGVLDFLKFEAGIANSGGAHPAAAAYIATAPANLSDRGFTSRVVTGNVVRVTTAAWIRDVAA
ncbi:MAG: type II toxin-antitoxin system MqsA family antitoxin [Rhodanobacteraceae bacterium]|nr:MAG: type II toxin-antitoxin system MqsA family antitoxin [Rhodanobacteraceae bacterium]